MAGVKSRPIPIVALDVPSAVAASRLMGELGDLCRYYKIGSELFTSEGPRIVESVLARGASVFLDLKFHDIPNTVRGAVSSAAGLGVQLLTVHASGGRAMIEAAVEAVGGARERCEVFAVTVLTSLTSDGVSVVWGRDIASMQDEVLRLANLAAESGAHGVVCSGEEARGIHELYGKKLAVLVPGIRLSGGERQDQARVVTPRDAAAAGAKYIVVGRAVTAAKSPRDAMSAILSDLP